MNDLLRRAAEQARQLESQVNDAVARGAPEVARRARPLIDQLAEHAKRALDRAQSAVTNATTPPKP